MTIQGLLAVVMILASSVLTAWASGDIAFPAILGMLGLLGVSRRFTWGIRPEKHFITPLLLLLLAILFALHCRYAHVRADQAAAFAWQTIARYFLASMILILFLRRQRAEEAEKVRTEESRNVLPSHLLPFSPSASGLPPSLGLFHLASMMAAGQILLLDDRYVAFRLTELLSVTLVILYAAVPSVVGSRTSVVGEWLRARRRLSTTDYRLLAGLAALLLVAINLGWIAGSLLYRHVESINFLPAWLSRGGAALDTTPGPTARVGFTDSGALSSIVDIKEGEPSVALTITGSNPTYLRAKAFATYRQGTWHELQSWEGIPPEQSASLGMLVGRTSLFRLSDTEASREMTIRHESTLPGDCMFTPLGTCFVEAPFGVVERNDDDVVKSHNVRLRHSYTVGFTASGTGRPPTSLQLYHLKELPKALDPEIRRKANRLFRPGMTTAQKIDAVTQYFHTNYTYVLGLDVPENQDPLNYFLLKASTGYCEYFASGAALLLRLADVPTRYVTGFLVTERGEDGRSWIARNMDAHAWAEAWDKEQGQWVIVEATTQEALEDASLADQLAGGTGGGRPFLWQLLDALYDYGLFGVVGRLFLSYGLLTGGVLSLLCFAAAWWVAVRRRRSPASLARRSLSAERLALQRLLALMDRQAAACGWRRQAGETLHAFAARLATAGSPLAVAGSPGTVDAGERPRADGLSDWYLQYAQLRYGGVLDPGRLEQLRLTVQKRRGADRRSNKI